MTIGILKEPDTETRVSLLPEAAASLTKQNIIVQLEKDAGFWLMHPVNYIKLKYNRR
jgi:NAD/NADP transhydrogenase alpha subunit